MHLSRCHLFVLVILTLIRVNNYGQEPFAWCIVPFDKNERNPQERINMLKDLGIQTYAYDWREKHLPEMSDEFILAQQNNVAINAVWMWIDPKVDAIKKLSSANESVIKTIEKTGLKTTLWVSFQPEYFKGLDDAAAVKKGAEMIYYLHDRCAAIGCKLALYNHGDWFGDPANQIKIIRTLGRYDIGLVYSFHHAHQQMNQFEQMVKMMVPYLVAVNLNGMKRGGPQIYPLGKGDDEKAMIDILLKAGYKGPFGILGHKEDADVKLILQENLEGYHQLFGKN
jgi:sugar phosphate isomerase/epimerase